MAESIGNLYSTQIPSLSETADIQEAFRLYHYGAPPGTGGGEYDPTNSNPANLVNPSIAYFLSNLQSQITTISGSLGVQATVWTTKGDLVTRTSSPGVVRIGVGADGTVLTANSSTSTGLAWSTVPVTLTNSVTLSNKTLTSPVINGNGITFEGSTEDEFEILLAVVDPTADRTITLPNVTGTVVTTGNLSDITSISIPGIGNPAGAGFKFNTSLDVNNPVSRLVMTIENDPSPNVKIGRNEGTAVTSVLRFGGGSGSVAYDVQIGVNGDTSLTTAGGGSFEVQAGRMRLTGYVADHPIPEVKNTNYILALTDDGKILEMNNTGTFLIPADSSVNFPVGAQITVIRTVSSGTVNIQANSGLVTVNGAPGLTLRAQWSGAVLIKRAANNWVVLGDLV